MLSKEERHFGTYFMTHAMRWSSYLHRFHADFSIILLSLQLQLHIEQSNLWVLIAFRLHFKPGVGESLFECDTGDQLGIL